MLTKRAILLYSLHMPEREQDFRIRLSGIHVDFEQKRVQLEAAGEPFAELAWSPDEGTVVFQAARHFSDLPQPTIEAETGAEKEATVTMSGKLKTQPRPGRPDAKGKPTAWARFAAHEENADEAHMYSATFHRHTAGLALKLPKDASITVQGYPHESEQADRMDTFSVINIVQYPGKEDRRPR